MKLSECVLETLAEMVVGDHADFPYRSSYYITGFFKRCGLPQELATIIPTIVVPVQTILLDGQREYVMFADLKHRYHWVLEPYKYEFQDSLLQHLDARVIRPAETKATELIRK